jgi:hypothetical protein
MKVGDYVCFSYLSNPKKGKYWLGKVKSLNPIVVTAQPDDRMNIEHVTIERKDVVCVLGQRPTSGKVFGVDTTNIYRCSKPLCDLFNSSVHYFCAPDKQVRKGIDTAFRIVAKAITKHKLQSLLDAYIFYKVRILPGKATGMYAHNKDYDTLDIDPFKCTITDLPEVIAHELGHHAFTYLEPEQQAKWMQLYIRHIKPQVYNKQDCERAKNYATTLTDLSQAKTDIPEEDLQLFNQCLFLVRQRCHLSYKQLNQLFQTDPQSVIDQWPTQVTVNDYEQLISSYATKNYNELFAESFAYYLLDKDLPKVVNNLMTKTFGQLRIQTRGVSYDNDSR